MDGIDNLDIPEYMKTPPPAPPAGMTKRKSTVSAARYLWTVLIIGVLLIVALFLTDRIATRAAFPAGPLVLVWVLFFIIAILTMRIIARQER